jgi:2-polyprenyl-3-methyl-5-hydroxy-6-metoxy-1,4-benzoquinol methylase
LRLLVCETCWLVQTEDHAGREQLFTHDYAYFSSVSTSWVAHAQQYVTQMTERFGLTASSQVIEVAANDGYLLQFVAARGIPCLGIEPTASTAQAARAKGLDIRESFFGQALALELVAQGHQADLMVANNVLAHVPDINDFVAGFATLLKPQGVVTFEFPHVMRMIEHHQFDTAYHEHYSYLSLAAVQRICQANGLRVFDVDELPTHGGSLRVYAQPAHGVPHPPSAQLAQVLAAELAAGLCAASGYTGFQAKAEKVKNDLLAFLLKAKQQGQRVGAYGAAAKGNTLLNFAGVRPDLLPYVVDRSPGKQGKFMPGSRIPIVAEEHIQEDRPDLVLLLPWNLTDELVRQLGHAREWNGRLVIAVPKLEILPW